MNKTDPNLYLSIWLNISSTGSPSACGENVHHAEWMPPCRWVDLLCKKCTQMLEIIVHLNNRLYTKIN